MSVTVSRLDEYRVEVKADSPAVAMAEAEKAVTDAGYDLAWVSVSKQHMAGGWSVTVTGRRTLNEAAA